MPYTDDDLIFAIFGADPAIARKAVEIYKKIHAGDPQPKEPKHCDECFEGCPKCEGTT